MKFDFLLFLCYNISTERTKMYEKGGFMYIRIELPIVTERVATIGKDINENIRLINVLTNQLKKQEKRIVEMEREKYELEVELDSLAQEEQEVDAKRVDCLSNKFGAIRQASNLGAFAFAKKMELKKKLQNLSTEHEKIEQKSSQIRARKDKISVRLQAIPKELNEVYLPNYKLHLTSLYGALREYEKKREVFENLTGIELERIVPGMLLDVHKEEKRMPTVKDHLEDFMYIKIEKKNYRKLVVEEDEM